MPSDDLLRDFMKTTRDDLKAIRKDVGDLMKFRWMVMGGAAMASLLFTLMLEVAKAIAEPKKEASEHRRQLDREDKKQVR